jgi:hypothetical protein
MDNQHHPKAEEIIRADDCETSRNDHTSLWIVYNPNGAGTSTPLEPTTTPNPPLTTPGGLPPLDLGGPSYCNPENGILCGLCQGDCDEVCAVCIGYLIGNVH